MLDLLGAMLGMMTVIVCAVTLMVYLTISNRTRLIIAGILGVWVGLAIGLAASGALAVTPGQPIPLVGVLFFTPLIVTAVLWFTLPRVRAALIAIPAPVLIGLNSLRVIGAIFLALAAVGRLSGPFPYSAAIGDVITGVLAAPLAYLAQRGIAERRGLIAGWTAFGTLDLLLAVGLGITSAQGSPLQLIHAGAGSEAMQFLPFSLVPTVLVPFFIITHGIVAAQLLAHGREAERADLEIAASAV